MCTIILILVTTTWLYPWGFQIYITVHGCCAPPLIFPDLYNVTGDEAWRNTCWFFCTVEVRECLPSLCSFCCIARLVLDNPREPRCWSSTSEPLSHSPHSTQHPAATIAISKNLLWSSIFKRQAPQNCSVLTKNHNNLFRGVGTWWECQHCPNPLISYLHMHHKTLHRRLKIICLLIGY